MASPTSVTKPRPGVEEWTNPQNGFFVCRIHYTADPEKRKPAWKELNARSMHPRAWRREYEIDWASPEGEPVIPEYEEAMHCRDYAVDPTLRLLRFWDFGFDSPVVLFAQLTLWDQLRFLWEICPFNTTIRQLIPMAQAVEQKLLGPDRFLGGDRAIDYTGKRDELDDEEAKRWTFETGAAFDGPSRRPESRTFDAGDPEGYSRKSLGVEAGVMAQHGLRLHTARPGTDASYANFRQRFLRSVMVPNRGAEAAIVFHSRMRLTRQALGGAFCRSVLPPYKPKAVHPFKDLVDAARYGNDNLSSVTQSHARHLHDLATRDMQETRA